MKQILILLLALITLSCNQSTPKEKVIVHGDRSIYALLDSTILYLPTKDTSEFNVKLYEGEYGLMLESPKALSGNLFGIRSTTGMLDRKKFSFDLWDVHDSIYVYGIHYDVFPSFWASYYLDNLDYCWIYYQYDDYSNKPDMIEFSPNEFNMYFKKTKAHIINY